MSRLLRSTNEGYLDVPTRVAAVNASVATLVRSSSHTISSPGGIKSRRMMLLALLRWLGRRLRERLSSMQRWVLQPVVRVLSDVRASVVALEPSKRLRGVLAGLAIGLLAGLVGCGGGFSPGLEDKCFYRRAHPRDECTLPRLIDTLSDRNTTEREIGYAAMYIASAGDKSPEALARLRALLREELQVWPPALPRPSCSECGTPYSPRAAFVINAISSFGESAAAARSELRQAYRSAATRVSWPAFWALADLGEDEVLPGLVSLLKSPAGDLLVRPKIVRALPKYGPRAKVAIPELLRLLEKGDPDAAGLLGVIGDPVTIDPLARSLNIENYRLRATVLEALASFGTGAASAVPAIEAMTGNWAPVVRARAWEALHAIDGREASEPTPRPAPTCLATPTDCPLVTESGTIPLKVSHPSVPNECAQMAKAVESDLGVLVGRSCLLSVDYGEWGTWFIEGDRVSGKTRRFCCGTGQFVTVHGHLLAIGYRIEEIDRAPDGSVKLEQLSLGPGAPMAYGLDANGDLVFMARGIGSLEPSAPKWPERWSPYYADRGKVAIDDSHSNFVLRLDPAGQLVEVH